MVLNIRVVYISLLICSTHAITNADNVTESTMFLYEKGVGAYLDNRFDACVVYFENAIQKYKEYTKKLQNCRIRCQQEADLSEPLYSHDIDNLLFFEKIVKNTLCIVKCKRTHKSVLHHSYINRETENLFQELKPYEYLHICYFQNKEYQKAASAAFTYLVLYPDDKIMSENLKYYSQFEGVNLKEVVNFEAKNYVYLYIHGADAYEKKDWNEVIEYMEESLAEYLQAEEECRALCEGPFDQGWYPDFIPAIANHFTFCLKCKQKCANRLNSLNGEVHNDLLPSHYHYLQYAYFKTGNLKSACAAVASYLLFYPDDATMLENREYYSKLPKASPDVFIPRPEAEHYIHRLTYERRILKYIAKEFIFEDPSNEITAEELKYRVIMTEKQLNGRNRFVAEGLATKKQCKMLIEVAKMFTVVGDGYEGKKSPHTTMERFAGITIDRSALLVYFGLLDHKYLKLLLELTNSARKKLQDFFKIRRKLYFTYTHLVLRTPLPNSPINRTDFSHPIHADNCIMMDDNNCLKKSPAYTWRDYSALIFLNEDFQGGDFFFSKDLSGNHIESVIKPKCGRMVAFSSGPENLHGVKAVIKGSRFVIALWFTHDENHVETEREVAENVLQNIG